MKRPPKSIKIGGRRVKVVYKDLPDLFGQFLADEMTIEIDRKCLDDVRLLKETLRHELAHAAFFLSGLSFILEDKLEEAVVRCLDGILFAALDELNL